MKRVLFACVGLVALAGAANAADLPRRGIAVPAQTPAFAPVAYNWSGAYVGINAGWGWGNSSWADRVGTTRDFDVDGGLIGGTLGYNWQAGQTVFGVETDLAWTGLEGTTRAICPTPGCTTSNNWLGTTRGRLGLAMDRWMPFISAGAAYGDIEANWRGPSQTENRLGWTLGGGVEVALAGNWTAKGEYLYVDLGEMNCNVAACGGAGNTRVEFNAHVLRAGLNYRF